MAKKKDISKETKETVEVKLENKVDKKKLFKELDDHVKEKKEEISEEISSLVEEQINFQVSKKMKEEEKRILRGKNSKIIKRDIVIVLLIAVIAYFGYCLYDVDYYNIRTKEIPTTEPTNNVQNNNDNLDDTTPVVEEYDASYYIANFGYLVDNLQINDSEIFDLYTKKYTSKTITNSLKLKIAYYNLDDSLKVKDSSDIVTIKASEILDSAQKIFGSNVSLNNEIFSYNNTKFMFYSDTYLGFYDTESSNNLVYKIINATENDNKLTFDLVIAKKQDDSLLNLKDKVIVKEYDDNITKYLEDLPKYQIVFEKEEENYIFSSIKSL